MRKEKIVSTIFINIRSHKRQCSRRIFVNIKVDNKNLFFKVPFLFYKRSFGYVKMCLLTLFLFFLKKTLFLLLLFFLKKHLLSNFSGWTFHTSFKGCFSAPTGGKEAILTFELLVMSYLNVRTSLLLLTLTKRSFVSVNQICDKFSAWHHFQWC